MASSNFRYFDQGKKNTIKLFCLKVNFYAYVNFLHKYLLLNICKLNCSKIIACEVTFFLIWPTTGTF